MAVLKIVKPETEAEKTTRTTMECWEVTPDLVKSWKAPPFQRPLRASTKLTAIAIEIRQNDGVIPGVLTIGLLDKERYLIDGQHRVGAFLESGCLTGYVDVRIAHYKTMAEMAEEFYKLNSRISVMKPDDYMRALETSMPLLARFRRRCSFVGYDNIRRNDKSPVASMSSVLRSWWMPAAAVPWSAVHGGAPRVAAMGEDEYSQLASLLELCFAAWNRDTVNHKLWNNLNLTLVMWLYRHTVLSTTSAMSVRLSGDQFKKCLITLSASEDYREWLRGRMLSDVNAAPCYRRIKETFARRLEEEFGKKVKLPAPDWGKS